MPWLTRLKPSRGHLRDQKPALMIGHAHVIIADQIPGAEGDEVELMRWSLSG